MQINFPVDKADLKRYASTLQVLRSHYWLQLPFSFLSFILLLTRAFQSSVTTKRSYNRGQSSNIGNNNNGHLQESDGGRNE